MVFGYVASAEAACPALWVPLAGARQVLPITTTLLAKPSWRPKAAHLAAHAKISGIIIAKVVMNEEREKSDQHVHCFVILFATQAWKMEAQSKQLPMFVHCSFFDRGKPD